MGELAALEGETERVIEAWWRLLELRLLLLNIAIAEKLKVWSGLGWVGWRAVGWRVVGCGGQRMEGQGRTGRLKVVKG